MSEALKFGRKIVFIVLCAYAIGVAKSQKSAPSISELKCQEYAEYRSESESNLDLSLSLEEGAAKCSNITRKYFDKFIKLIEQNLTDETATVPGLMKFPHMALIGYRDSGELSGIKWACGGSLISENHVLTLARCLQEPMKYVLLGELDISTDDDIARPVVYTILEKRIHPNYNAKELYNDIAVLKLNETIRIDEYVRPVCLHTMHEIKAKEAVATGWGEDADGQRHDHLQEVDLELISFGNCSETYIEFNYTGLPRGIDDEAHLCAGSYTSAKDTCAGDGGGPLQIYHSKYKCMFDLIGITSFGFPQCGTNKPGVYTRVSSYLNWIEDIVWPAPEIKIAKNPRQQRLCDGWHVFCYFYRIFH